MRELTITRAGTFRSFMPISSGIPTRAPLTQARTYSPRKLNSTTRMISRMTRTTPVKMSGQLELPVSVVTSARMFMGCLVPFDYSGASYDPRHWAVVDQGDDFHRAAGFDDSMLAGGFDADAA